MKTTPDYENLEDAGDIKEADNMGKKHQPAESFFTEPLFCLIFFSVSINISFYEPMLV